MCLMTPADGKSLSAMENGLILHIIIDNHFTKCNKYFGGFHYRLYAINKQKQTLLLFIDCRLKGTQKLSVTVYRQPLIRSFEFS